MLPLIPRAIESIRGREAPKTIVGFLVVVYGMLMAGATATAIGLATTKEADLVVYVLIFIAVITVAFGIVLLVITWKDPSRLMLGPMSGREYAALRYILQGDDSSGERIERLLGPPVIEAAPDREQLKPPSVDMVEGTRPDPEET